MSGFPSFLRLVFLCVCECVCARACDISFLKQAENGWIFCSCHSCLHYFLVLCKMVSVPFWGLFVLILLGVCCASWLCKLMFFMKFGSYEPLFLYLYFLAFSFSPVILCSHYIHIDALDIVPQVSEALLIFSHVFFSVYFQLNNIYWSLSSLILSHLKSAIEPI